MPELPDLEVFAKNLTLKLKGQSIASVKVHVPAAVDRPVMAVQKMLKGKKILRVERSGKQLRFYCNDDISFFVHLMLHGSFVVAEKKEAVRFSLVEFLFNNDQKLVLTDFQKKVRIQFDAPQQEAPDALSPTVNTAFLRSLLKGRRTAIKKLLTDQTKIRGIGSAYADEMLWAAGISPFSPAYALPDEKVRLLSHYLKKVLRDAIKQISRSHPGIISGEVRDHMKVHHKEKTNDPEGYPILKKKEGGCTTYYSKRQILYS